MSNAKLKEVQDSEWIRQSFMIPGATAANGANSRARDMGNAREFSEGFLSFADTSLGGNRSVNPKPQFTKNADPNMDSLLTDTTNDGVATQTTSMGMGTYYAESIDLHAQRIYMQFGVPAFNSLTNFFTSYYDMEQGDMANTGKVDGLLYTAAKYTGYMILWPVKMILGVTNLIYSTYRTVTKQPMNKYYYLKPTMVLYWSMVNTITNAVATNMGLIQGVDGDAISRSPGQAPTIDDGSTVSNEELNRLLPDIMRNGNGGIDVRSIAGRYQRLSDAHDRSFAKIAKGATDIAGARAEIEKYLDRDPVSYINNDGYSTMDEYIDAYKESSGGKNTGLEAPLSTQGSIKEKAVKFDNNVTDAIADVQTQLQTDKALFTGISEYIAGFADAARAEARDGSKYVSFIVDHQDTVSESFTNTTRESSIAQSANQTSSEARSRTYDMAGGNIGDDVLSEAIEFIAGGVKELIAGTAKSIGLSGLAALGGKAFMDMPEFWESSSTTLPTNTYTMELRSPYGNGISVLNNIIVPLSMLLAGTAPRSTGKNSYTGPFICKLWSQGRNKVELGMITSLNITRGAGGVGWNIHDQAVGIDVSFTVTNLSKMLHMPISNEVSLTDALGITSLDEDNNFTDYMATLGALSMNDQIYTAPRWRIAQARAAREFKDWASPENLAMNAMDTTIGRFVSAVAKSRAF